jgi:hypothetical protein
MGQQRIGLRLLPGITIVDPGRDSNAQNKTARRVAETAVYCFGTHTQFAALIRKGIDVNTRIIKAAGIKPE